VLTQALAAAASVGVLLALAGVLTLSKSANMRALAVIYAVAWLPLVLALVGLEAALSSAIVAVPTALTQAGRTIAALLAGLALLPAITIAVASARPDAGDVRAALGYYVANALKLVLLVATSAANISFGLVRGVPLEVALFVAVVLETGLVLALLKASGGGLHALALLTFGAAVGMVAVETLATLSGLAALPELARIGEALYLLTPAIAIAYIVATALSERKRARDREWAGVVSWAAGQVRGARVGWAALADAAREPIALPGRDDDEADGDDDESDGRRNGRVRTLNATAPAASPTLRAGDPDDLRKRTARDCAWCGRTFTGRGRSKYCSSRCKQAAFRGRARRGA